MYFLILLVTCHVVKCNSLSLKDDIVVSAEMCSEIRNLMAFEWAMRTMTISNLVWNFLGMFSLNVTRQIVYFCENHVAFLLLVLYCCWKSSWSSIAFLDSVSGSPTLAGVCFFESRVPSRGDVACRPEAIADDKTGDGDTLMVFDVWLGEDDWRSYSRKT